MAELHTGFDSRRFIVPDGGEASFAEFFRLELDRPEAALLIAEDEQGLVGYAFVRMEIASVEELRGPGAWLHDLYQPVGKGPILGGDDEPRWVGWWRVIEEYRAPESPGVTPTACKGDAGQ